MVTKTLRSEDIFYIAPVLKTKQTSLVKMGEKKIRINFLSKTVIPKSSKKLPLGE